MASLVATSLYDSILKLYEQDEFITDVHITVNEPLWVRRSGDLERVTHTPVEEGDLRSLLGRLAKLTKPEDKMEPKKEFNFSATLAGKYENRCHLCLSSNGQLSMMMRRLRSTIPTLDDLNLQVLKRHTEKSKGIVLVTGATGSGKSTTLAAMINEINMVRPAHILTIEDPVEYRHVSKNSKVTSRQIGLDVPDFAAGLRAALRADPDVILIGEIRDSETMRAALQAADTGHLVFATLHTNNSVQTVQRVASFFPADEKQWALQVFANVLNCSISQNLIRKANGKGVSLAYEVMINNSSVRQNIIDDKPALLINSMRQGKQDGHILMNRVIAEQITNGTIRREAGMAASYDSDELGKILTGQV